MRGGRPDNREGVRCTSAHLTSSELQSARSRAPDRLRELLDKTLGVLAPHEGLDGIPERARRRERAVNGKRSSSRIPITRSPTQAPINVPASVPKMPASPSTSSGFSAIQDMDATLNPPGESLGSPAFGHIRANTGPS